MTVLEPVIAWLIAYKRKTFTLTQVKKGANRPRRPVLRVMDRLVREGYLKEIEDEKIPRRSGEGGPSRRNPTWMILKKPLSMPKQQAKRQTKRDTIWNLIRHRRHFTVVEIQRLSGAAYDTVRTYVRMLERDGYVRKTGQDGHRITWMLIKGHNETGRPVTKEKKR